jgi:hypothetical protein
MPTRTGERGPKAATIEGSEVIAGFTLFSATSDMAGLLAPLGAVGYSGPAAACDSAAGLVTAGGT